MLRKILLGIFATAMVLAIVYMLGPKLQEQEIIIEFPEVPTRLSELQSYVDLREDTVIGLKPGNEAYIVWADSMNKHKTPYSIVYIHGFGASPMEGDPVHRFLAAHFGANLFVTRLPDHGIKRENGLEYVSPQALSPWMQKLMQWTMMKNKIIHQNREGEKAMYWSEDYHMNVYESLAMILYGNMNEATFKKIHQPLFLAYYYKDNEAQDDVVSVPKMKEMFEQISTPAAMKREQAFPNTGDHVIGSSITSGDWEGVLFSTIDFLENVVKIPAKPEYQEKVEDLMQIQETIQNID